jgi:hypothetical protein
LPLCPSGSNVDWEPAALDDAQEGRLSRYCTAGNSELVFASAVVFVEGEGDLLTMQHLLERLCADTGGYYARGITVIEAGGVSKIRRLVELAEHFGVRAYILTDRDGLRADDGRQLFKALNARSQPPSREDLDALRAAADRRSDSYTDALENQLLINDLLKPYDAYVMCSDLEGLTLDVCGERRALDLLGLNGEQVLAQEFVTALDGDPDSYSKLRSRLGSKGWAGDARTSGKLDPHVPALMLEALLDDCDSVPTELSRLMDWLRAIVDGSSHTAI